MKTEIIIRDNYDLVWKNFLQLEIKRSCEAVKLLGNANTYLVLQVVVWHNFLLVTDSIKEHDRDKIIEKWLKKKTDRNRTYILTYTLISELTALPLETVRRHVKKLIKNNWVKYSKKSGVEFDASKKNNKSLIESFNIKETDLVLDFLEYVNRFSNKYN